MEISKIDIQTLLPQQRPFVMIDRLLECDDTMTKTDFKVLAGNIFSKDGQLIEPGIIENIAQTCAARMGYINKVANSGKVRIGFIGSIKNLSIYRLPKIGEKMVTQINIQSEVFNITLINAAVTIDEEKVAECEMKISLQ